MIESIIDDIWASLLAAVLKHREALRPQMGDYIDLCVPQSRLLSLVESNPAVPRLLYLAAQSSARRNAYIIVRKLGMPADYFWKFEFWTKDRASTTLSGILNRIFSSIINYSKQGNLKMTELSVEPLRIGINFEDCTECAGLSGVKQAVCFYHAGLFTGIISALINRDLDGFETSCCALGDKSCQFIIGDKSDKYIITGFDSYVSRVEINTDVKSRLEKSFNNFPLRAMGNFVDVNYLQLVMASTLTINPQLFASTNFRIGDQQGRQLAPVLSELCGRERLLNITEFYSRLRHSKVEIKDNGSQIELIIAECADFSPPVVGVNAIEMISFLTGEMQGLISGLVKKEMILKEHHFEDKKLILIFTPKL